MIPRRTRTRALALIGTLAFSSVALAQGTTTTTDEAETTETIEAESTETGDTTRTAADPAVRAAELRRLKKLKRQAVRLKRKAIRWKRLMQKPRPRITNRPAFETKLEQRLWLREAWKRRALRARAQVKRPPHLAAWRCIHRHEGPWNDPHAPYYGGLQMDLTFQRMYGRELVRRRGTANRWTRLEQMWVAERALRAGRGFYPWPVAARRCGLI